MPTSAEEFSPSSATNSYRLVTQPLANKNDAQSLLETVKSELPNAALNKSVTKQVFHRVTAGRFNDMPPALRVRAELLKQNITSFIMQSKSKYTVIVGSYISEQLALDEQKRLASKGIKTSICKFNRAKDSWQINSGTTYDLREAVYTATLMSLKDVTTTIE